MFKEAKDGGTDVPVKQMSLKITVSSTNVTAGPLYPGVGMMYFSHVALIHKDSLAW